MGAREELDALSASLDGLAASASAYARAALAQWLASNPSAPRAERASFAAGLLMEVSGAFGAQAAEAAMGFLAALSVEPGDASPSVGEAYAARKGAWIASLEDAAALEAAGDTAASYVRRDAFEASARACGRAGVRWARVPTGSETCAFCFMLASRGYAYTSEHAARGGMGMHAHCDCKVVPETAGKIEGYDPDELYRRWRICAETVAADPDATGRDTLRAIMREVERRDWEWLWTGTVPEITVQDGAKPKAKERRVASSLSAMGFRVEFLKPENVSGRHTADVLVNGVRLEMKQPVGDAVAKTIGKNTIDHQFEEASLQARSLVLDLTVIEDYPDVGFDVALRKAVELFGGKWKDSFDELVVFSKAGIRRYRNAQ